MIKVNTAICQSNTLQGKMCNSWNW